MVKSFDAAKPERFIIVKVTFIAVKQASIAQLAIFTTIVEQWARNARFALVIIVARSLASIDHSDLLARTTEWSIKVEANESLKLQPQSTVVELHSKLTKQFIIKAGELVGATAVFTTLQSFDIGLVKSTAIQLDDRKFG